MRTFPFAISISMTIGLRGFSLITRLLLALPSALWVSCICQWHRKRQHNHRQQTIYHPFENNHHTSFCSILTPAKYFNLVNSPY